MFTYADRPTFAELKHLLAKQYYDTSPVPPHIMPSTESLSKSTEEFKSVEKQFSDGWPDELKSQIQVAAIHKINNPSLESRYQQFVRSNTKFATEEYTEWHGTSAKCNDGSCMSSCPIAALIARMNCHTVVVSRDYYIGQTNYLLLYNNFAAIPTYIVVYSVQTKSLQVRIGKDDYCSFHNEYHGCGGLGDGHYGGSYASCLDDSSHQINQYDGKSRDNPYKLPIGWSADSMEKWFLSVMKELNTSNFSEDFMFDRYG